MLTDKDIDRLMEIFPTKNEVESIIDRKLEPLIDLQKQMLTGLDKLATAIEGQNLENAARDAKVSRHDKWIHKIAKETKVSIKD